MFPIVDAHQHFWDPLRNRHPWLAEEPPRPFRYGDTRPLRRRYLPADYLRDAAGYRVEKTVYVETEWDPADPIGEMRYVESLRREHGLPSVAVAQAWLDRDDLAEVLEQQAAFAFVRGIRHKPRTGEMREPKWRAGFARLERHGLRFDLQAPWSELGDAAKLAADFGTTTIIVNHAGLPADRSPEGLEGWRRAMRLLAAQPNVAVKISGLGQPGKRWTVEANRGIVRTVIDLFGPGRCMFASNYPVDSLCVSFTTLFDGFRAMVQDLSPEEQRALFRDTALRLYGIPS